jgi:hypothetical protein
MQDEIKTLTDELARLRKREEDATELLECWFNLASNVVGAPKSETLEWLAAVRPPMEASDAG